jgi:hypothetical protein
MGKLGKALGRKALQRVATIATPDTVLRWYRELVGGEIRRHQEARTRAAWSTSSPSGPRLPKDRCRALERCAGRDRQRGARPPSNDVASKPLTLREPCASRRIVSVFRSSAALPLSKLGISKANFGIGRGRIFQVPYMWSVRLTAPHSKEDPESSVPPNEIASTHF